MLFRSINTTVFTNAEIQEMNYSADTGVFYDLLPPWYHLDQTRPIQVAGYTSNGSISSAHPAALTSVTVQPNFRDTGRDLVTFQVQSLLDPHLNIYRNTYTYTGFTVKFWTVVSYFDVDENPVWNICEYRRGDEKAMSGSAYDDNRGYSTAANASHYQVNGIYPLTNLDGDGVAESKTAMYYSVSIRPTYVGATQNGLSKLVRATAACGRHGT